MICIIDKLKKLCCGTKDKDTCESELLFVKTVLRTHFSEASEEDVNFLNKFTKNIEKNLSSAKAKTSWRRYKKFLYLNYKVKEKQLANENLLIAMKHILISKHT